MHSSFPYTINAISHCLFLKLFFWLWWHSMGLVPLFSLQTCTEKRSWSVIGVVLQIWSTTAFWIPAKPLHLGSMLSQLMRCTENCNACSGHWSTQRAHFSTVRPACMSHNQCFKSWRVGLWSFVWSTIFTWPLANRLPLLQASQQLFAGKMLQQPAGGRKSFPRVHWILKDFYATGISQLISHWRKCVDYNDSYFD